MADEIRVTTSLSINKDNLSYQSQPSAFVADMTGSGGPSPGLLNVTTSGRNISFTELTSPGLMRIQNQSTAYSVRWGIHDGAIFHPVGKLLPGESYIFRLDPDLGEEEADTGTGTSASINALYLKAIGGTCKVLVEAFDA
jgi:hypothetical protein